MRLVKLVMMPVAVAVLMAAALLVPGAAQAKAPSALLSLRSDVFPTGTAVPDGLSGDIPVAGGASVKLNAPKYVYVAPTPPATEPTVYEFMFWDANSTLVTTTKATFTAPAAGSTVDAIAWYLPIGGGVCVGICPPAVSTWAYVLTSHKFVPGTPIASVTPASAGWKAPSTAVSTASAVKITAQSFLGPHTATSGDRFSSWFVFGGSGVTISGADVSVPAGESPYAIAFYTYVKPPTKPICIGAPHCI